MAYENQFAGARTGLTIVEEAEMVGSVTVLPDQIVGDGQQEFFGILHEGFHQREKGFRRIGVVGEGS